MNVYSVVGARTTRSPATPPEHTRSTSSSRPVQPEHSQYSARERCFHDPVLPPVPLWRVERSQWRHTADGVLSIFLDGSGGGGFPLPLFFSSRFSVLSSQLGQPSRQRRRQALDLGILLVTLGDFTGGIGGDGPFRTDWASSGLSSGRASSSQAIQNKLLARVLEDFSGACSSGRCRADYFVILQQIWRGVSMRYRFQIAGLLVLCAFVAVGADAQMVASHAPHVGGSGRALRFPRLPRRYSRAPTHPPCK